MASLKYDDAPEIDSSAISFSSFCGPKFQNLSIGIRANDRPTVSFKGLEVRLIP